MAVIPVQRALVIRRSPKRGYHSSIHARMRSGVLRVRLYVLLPVMSFSRVQPKHLRQHRPVINRLQAG